MPGGRHQYWIIAKINSRYRTMAGVYHQAPVNEQPRACWRLLQILGHPANKKLVAHECKYAATFTESLWDDLAINPNKTDITKAIPFPFTATCLALAAGFDRHPGKSYYRAVDAFHTTINYTEAYNCDDYTIVDATNLDDIHYCFLPPFKSWRENKSSQIIKRPLFTPLTAEEYIAKYADTTTDDAKVDVDLSCWGLINADTLRNLWPDVNWCDRNDDGPGGRHIEQEVRTTSLKELAIVKVIEKYLDNPKVEQELCMVEQLPDFFVCLRKWLHKFPESIKSPHGLRILGRSMKGAKCLDLSAFHWLPEEVIIQLVKENADVDIVDSVDLSTNTTVTASGIEKLLQVCPNITKLFTLHTPKLSMDALAGAVAKSNVDELFHAELVRSSFDPLGMRPWEIEPTYATRSEAVTQIVYLSAPNSAKADDSCRLDQKGLRWSKLKLALEYELYTNGDRLERGLFATCIPVRDAFLVLSRVTDWFDQVLNFFGSHIETCDQFGYKSHRWERSILEAFARAIALELRVRNLNIGCSSY